MAAENIRFYVPLHSVPTEVTVATLRAPKCHQHTIHAFILILFPSHHIYPSPSSFEKVSLLRLRLFSLIFHVMHSKSQCFLHPVNWPPKCSCTRFNPSLIATLPFLTTLPSSRLPALVSKSDCHKDNPSCWTRDARMPRRNTFLPGLGTGIPLHPDRSLERAQGWWGG